MALAKWCELDSIHDTVLEGNPTEKDGLDINYQLSQLWDLSSPA